MMRAPHDSRAARPEQHEVIGLKLQWIPGKRNALAGMRGELPYRIHDPLERFARSWIDELRTNYADIACQERPKKSESKRRGNANSDEHIGPATNLYGLPEVKQRIIKDTY